MAKQINLQQIETTESLSWEFV